MSASAVVGIALGVVSAGAVNAGLFLEHGAVATGPALALAHPLRSLRILFTNRRWLIGYAGGIAGWGLYIIALAVAPLSLVQAASAGGIGVLALLAWRVGAEVPGRNQRIGIASAIAGLILLGLSIRSEVPPSVASAPGVLGWVAGCVVVAVAAVWPLAGSIAPGAGYGIAAGCMYAAGDIATKGALGSGGGRWLIPILLICHLTGFVAMNLGFQKGTAMATAGPATLLLSSIPIVAGLTLFREPIPPGLWGVVRFASFLSVIAGALLLARGEAEGPSVALRPGVERLSVS